MGVQVDKWRVDEDGRYIGHDGFRVPQTGHEFLSEHFAIVERWAGAFLRQSNPTREAVSELAQELAIKILASQVVERYEPAKLGVCDEKAFMVYVHGCLRRYVITRWDVSKRNPLETPVSIDADPDDSEDYVELRITRALSHEPDPVARIDLLRLREFISAYSPDESSVITSSDLISVYDLMLTGSTFTEAAEAIGVSRSRVKYLKATLHKLAKRFKDGQR